MILFDPSDNALITVEWDGLGDATVTGAQFTLPSPLVLVSAPVIDNGGDIPSTTFRVRGAVHGWVYDVEGQVTLDTGETIGRNFRIRGWNGW